MRQFANFSMASPHTFIGEKLNLVLGFSSMFYKGFILTNANDSLFSKLNELLDGRVNKIIIYGRIRFKYTTNI